MARTERYGSRPSLAVLAADIEINRPLGQDSNEEKDGVGGTRPVNRAQHEHVVPGPSAPVKLATSAVVTLAETAPGTQQWTPTNRGGWKEISTKNASADVPQESQQHGVLAPTHHFVSRKEKELQAEFNASTLHGSKTVGQAKRIVRVEEGQEKDSKRKYHEAMASSTRAEPAIDGEGEISLHDLVGHNPHDSEASAAASKDVQGPEDQEHLSRPPKRYRVDRFDETAETNDSLATTAVGNPSSTSQARVSPGPEKQDDPADSGESEKSKTSEGQEVVLSAGAETELGLGDPESPVDGNDLSSGTTAEARIIKRKRKTITYRGPLFATDQKLRSLLHTNTAKNDSSLMDDKLWTLITGRPKIQSRAKYEKSGKILTNEVAKEWLTVKFEYKESPENTMTCVFEEPSDWNDKKAIEMVIDDISQTIRREGGTNKAGRPAYEAAEMDWIVEYFEPAERKGYQGKQFFDDMAAAMNEKFEGSQLMTKNGKKQIRPHRAGHALLSKCTRNTDRIAAARGPVKHPKKKAKAVTGEVAEDGATAAVDGDSTLVEGEDGPGEKEDSTGEKEDTTGEKKDTTGAEESMPNRREATSLDEDTTLVEDYVLAVPEKDAIADPDRFEDAWRKLGFGDAERDGGWRNDAQIPGLRE